MVERRIVHPLRRPKYEKAVEQIIWKYSRFKVAFYSKIKFDADTRKIIKFVNQMQGS